MVYTSILFSPRKTQLKYRLMNLKEILSISGKPGLYKLVAQSRTGVIVESLADGKRFPVMASQNVSSLGDIAIYTYSDEMPLADIFRAIFEKEEGKNLHQPQRKRSYYRELYRRDYP